MTEKMEKMEKCGCTDKPVTPSNDKPVPPVNNNPAGPTFAMPEPPVHELPEFKGGVPGMPEVHEKPELELPEVPTPPVHEVPVQPVPEKPVTPDNGTVPPVKEMVPPVEVSQPKAHARVERLAETGEQGYNASIYLGGTLLFSLYLATRRKED